MGRIIPWIMENKKCLKPPTRNVPPCEGVASTEAASIRTQIEGSGLLTLPTSGAAICASLGTGAKQQRPNVRQQVKGVDGVHHSDPNSCRAARGVPV